MKYGFLKSGWGVGDVTQIHGRLNILLLWALTNEPVGQGKAEGRYIFSLSSLLWAFPGGSDGKESACKAGLIPGLGRSPREGNGNLLKYSCLENSMDRGAWRAVVHGVAKESDMTEQLTLKQPIPLVYSTPDLENKIWKSPWKIFHAPWMNNESLYLVCSKIAGTAHEIMKG